MENSDRVTTGAKDSKYERLSITPCHGLIGLTCSLTGDTGGSTESRRAAAGCAEQSATGDPLVRTLQKPQRGKSGGAAGLVEAS